MTEPVGRRVVQQVQRPARDVAEVVAHLERRGVVVHRAQHLELVEDGLVGVEAGQVVDHLARGRTGAEAQPGGDPLELVLDLVAGGGRNGGVAQLYTVLADAPAGPTCTSNSRRPEDHSSARNSCFDNCLMLPWR